MRYSCIASACVSFPHVNKTIHNHVNRTIILTRTQLKSKINLQIVVKSSPGLRRFISSPIAKNNRSLTSQTLNMTTSANKARLRPCSPIPRSKTTIKLAIRDNRTRYDTRFHPRVESESNPSSPAYRASCPRPGSRHNHSGPNWCQARDSHYLVCPRRRMAGHQSIRCLERKDCCAQLLVLRSRGWT